MPTEILMPALSPTMEEGKLAKWLVKEGQTVKAGDIIAEIETDKATMEVEAVDEGKVGKLLVAEGTEGVKVNTPIAMLLAEGESAGAPPAPKAPTPAPRRSAAADGAIGGSSPARPAPARPQGRRERAHSAREADPPRPSARRAAPTAMAAARIFASPLARRLAKERGLDLAALAGSGPHGRIIKRDVEAALKDGGAAAAAAPAPRWRRRRPASPGALDAAARCRTTRSSRSTRRAPTRSCRTTACAGSSPSG